MPLVTLMERQAVVFEGMELWESSDQSGEIMLRHLGTARLIARHAKTFRRRAEQLLQGRRDCCSATPPGAGCLPAQGGPGSQREKFFSLWQELREQ